MVSKKTSFILLICATLLVIMVLYLLKPIPHLQSYHIFADQRSWLGIPHAWNVLSNIVFLGAGLWGLFLLLTPQKVHFNDHKERWLWIGVSVGLVLTAIGSSYYHLAPDNSRLLWDRLPMTLVFMSLVAALIGERINIYLGLWLWPIFLAMGIYSVWLWYISELHHTSDIRFYIGVQFYAILMTAIMLISPAPYDRNGDLAVVLVCYGLALLFDFFDHQVYKMTGDSISGHTLKHLAAGLAGAWLIYMISKRKKENFT